MEVHQPKSGKVAMPVIRESYEEGDADVESSQRLISSTFHHKTCATQPQPMRKPC